MAARAITGRTMADSTPAFTPQPRPPAGAPNVVLVVLDDLGFAQLGCFGSDIETPAIDGVAAGGLRFNRFHVTVAVLADARLPAHRAQPPRRRHGLPHRHSDRAARLQRAHPAQRRHAAAHPARRRLQHLRGRQVAPRAALGADARPGPFERWPLGLGFERYYGFLNGDTNQWTPELVRDNGFVDPPRRAGGAATTSPRTSPTRRIRMIQDQQQATPDKPFFLYFAPGAMHAPHHAPRAWIERYRGRFDDGWEAWRARAFARQLEIGHRAGRHDAHRAAVVDSRPGRRCRPSSAACSPA